MQLLPAKKEHILAARKTHTYLLSISIYQSSLSLQDPTKIAFLLGLCVRQAVLVYHFIERPHYKEQSHHFDSVESVSYIITCSLIMYVDAFKCGQIDT